MRARRLVHTAARSGAVELTASAGLGEVAVRVAVDGDGGDPLAAPLGLAVGGLAVLWQPAAGSWEMRDPSGTVVATAAAPAARLPMSWLLLVTRRGAQFLLDERPLLAWLAPAPRPRRGGVPASRCTVPRRRPAVPPRRDGLPGHRIVAARCRSRGPPQRHDLSG